jgi:ABC-type Fe3+ transport system permease subunit
VSEDESPNHQNTHEKALEDVLGFGPTIRLKAQTLKSDILGKALQLYRELDYLSSTQLAAILVVFSLFLIFPIGYVMLSAFIGPVLIYNPGTGLIEVIDSWSLFWFQILLGDQYYLPLYFVQAQSNNPVHIHPLGFYLRVRGPVFELVGVGSNEYALLVQGVDMGVIMNSLYSALLTTLFSTLIGVTLAFIMARYDFRGKTVLRTLLLIPLLAIPFVGAIGIQRMLALDGTINNLFWRYLGIWPYRILIDGLAAVILIQTLHFFSLTYLSSYSAFQNIDPTLEESAENMGAKGFTLFRKVTLPLALPGIEAGAILVFIMSIEDLGTLLVYQGSTQVRKTLTYAIFSHIFAPDGTVEGIATAMGVILLLIAIVGFFFIRRYMSLRNYAMLSKGGTWNPRLTVSKWFHYILFYGFIIGLLSVALLPHVGVFLLAFAVPGTWGTFTLIPQLWIGNWLIVFTDPGIFGAIVNSLVYSFIACFLIAVIGVSAAYIVARKNIPGKDALDLLVTIPIALPGIVIAIGFLMFFSRNPVLSPILSPAIPGAAAILITMSYTVRKMPFTVRSAFAGLQQTHVELEEAAFNLGSGRLRTFAKIVLPLIGVSILAGVMMSFVYCMSEVSTSIVLGDIDQSAAPITWKMSQLLYGLAMGPSLASVLGLILMLLQTVVMATTNTILKKRTSALVGL